MMEKCSVGHNELMEFPYEKYLEYSKIISLEQKEEKKEQERQKSKIK